MAEIVNFRRAKKARARAEQAKDAGANRAKFGTPKAERDLVKTNNASTEKRLAGHKLKSDSDQNSE